MAPAAVQTKQSVSAYKTSAPALLTQASIAGPLTGIALGIPSYHVLEPEIADQFDRALYERELALSALAMDVAEVVAPLKTIRDAAPV